MGEAVFSPIFAINYLALRKDKEKEK